jgi:DNA processing protein
MVTPSDFRAWLALCAIKGVGESTLFRLVQAFGSPQRVMEVSPHDLMRHGCSSGAAKALAQGADQSTRQWIEQGLKQVDRLKGMVVTCLDPRYPERLKAIPDPPLLLYLTGSLDPKDDLAIAVVGARRATAGGRVVTETLSRNLAAAGLTVVSGLARGVDAAAHRGALDAKGRTIAVMGCGIERTYPPEHEKLRVQVEAQGAVISELPIGAAPHSYHFPRRNRIISGLCLGVVVTEATMQSGSLITARLALDQGREVFGVPGSIQSENSRGPHSLIKQGAKLVESAQDILDELLPQLDDRLRSQVVTPARQREDAAASLDAVEARVYHLLSHEPVHIDDLIARSGMTAGEVTAVLLGLELKHHARQLPGPSYLRVGPSGVA